MGPKRQSVINFSIQWLLGPGCRNGIVVRFKGMRNEFTAIIEQDGEWYIAYCLEIPGR